MRSRCVPALASAESRTAAFGNAPQPTDRCPHSNVTQPSCSSAVAKASSARSTSMRRRGPSSIGQRARIPLDETHADTGFQTCQPLAHHGEGNPKSSRGRRQAALGQDRAERLELIQIVQHRILNFDAREPRFIAVLSLAKRPARSISFRASASNIISMSRAATNLLSSS